VGQSLNLMQIMQRLKVLKIVKDILLSNRHRNSQNGLRVASRDKLLPKLVFQGFIAWKMFSKVSEEAL
jgi:hypothetical protein